MRNQHYSQNNSRGERGGNGRNENWRSEDRDDHGRFSGSHSSSRSRNGQYEDDDGRQFGRNNERSRDEEGRFTSDYRGGSNDEWMGGTAFGRDNDERESNASLRGSAHADYHHWRAGEIQKMDDEYGDYLKDRRSKFNDDFSKWRDNKKNTSSASNGESGSAAKK